MTRQHDDLELYMYVRQEIRQVVEEEPEEAIKDLLKQMLKLPSFAVKRLLKKARVQGFWLDETNERELTERIVKYGFNNMKAWATDVNARLRYLEEEQG